MFLRYSTTCLNDINVYLQRKEAKAKGECSGAAVLSAVKIKGKTENLLADAENLKMLKISRYIRQPLVQTG